jgi:hypothetical protein
MNTQFENWLIADTDAYNGVQKNEFLRALKFRSSDVLRSIEKNLFDWAGAFSMAKGKAIRHSPGDGMAESILASWQEHYKEELSQITA